MHLIAHVLGLDNASGPFYLFWSGIGLSVFWPLAFLAKHNCHSKGCWRIGKHAVDGTPFCTKHHPNAKAVL